MELLIKESSKKLAVKIAHNELDADDLSNHQTM